MAHPSSITLSPVYTTGLLTPLKTFLAFLYQSITVLNLICLVCRRQRPLYPATGMNRAALPVTTVNHASSISHVVPHSCSRLAEVSLEQAQTSVELAHYKYTS